MRVKKNLCIRLLLAIVNIVSLTSCSGEYLNIKGVAYQSLSSTRYTLQRVDIPNDAKIIVGLNIDREGRLDVVVQNNTNKIMIIDRTKSFFTNNQSESYPYYDPTVHVQSQSTTHGTESGASVNVGAIAGAVGIGGSLGTALNGVNVGGSIGNATTNTNTTFIVDQPTLSIAPHGRANMGRPFKMPGVGSSFLKQAIGTATKDVYNEFQPSQTYASYSICISYSTDNGQNYETIITDIYASTLLLSKVKQTGKVNDALRSILTQKTDALYEPLYIINFDSNSNDGTYFQLPEIFNYN